MFLNRFILPPLLPCLCLFFLFKFADMKKLLELDPSNDQARRSIHRLEPIAAEKREKMKEEMIGMCYNLLLFHIFLSSTGIQSLAVCSFDGNIKFILLFMFILII